MTHLYTLTSPVVVAKIGLQSLCVKRSWPQHTPVMCDNSNDRAWHITGDEPQNLSPLDQNHQLCSTWLQVWGQVELLVCCLVWQTWHDHLLPLQKPSIHGTSFEEPKSYFGCALLTFHKFQWHGLAGVVNLMSSVLKFVQAQQNAMNLYTGGDSGEAAGSYMYMSYS